MRCVQFMKYFLFSQLGFQINNKMKSEEKPGISLETSEVFETCDLPESDQVVNDKV